MAGEIETIQPRRLSPTVLCRLLNSLGRGEVISERQLRRHRTRAGYTIGDAKTVDLFRYAAWLTLEHYKPKDDPASYEEVKRRQAERNAELVRAAQDIGDLPEVVDLERKARCESSFREFCETYFPEVFYLPWSDDHLRVIDKIEKAVRTGGWDLDQARTHNPVNEIDSITATTGSNWIDPSEDAAGNVVLSPRALAPHNVALTLTYDAWNRLVAVYDVAYQYTLATYEYDGFGRRIVKTVYEEEDPLETRDYYYSAAWQVLEERVDGASTANRQYIWGQRYIDDLILRDRSTVAGGNLGKTGSGLDERLYALQDANFNVTALANTSGTVVERFAYQGYGTPKVLDPNWSDDLNNQSDFGWETLFAGYRYDSDTGLYHVRNRYYHAPLGRWLTRDPLGYVDGMNFYEYVMSSPVIYLDPLGLEMTQAELQAAYDARNMASTAIIVEDAMHGASVVTDNKPIAVDLKPAIQAEQWDRVGMKPGGSVLGNTRLDKLSTVGSGIGTAQDIGNAIADPNASTIGNAAQSSGEFGLGIAANMGSKLAGRLNIAILVIQTPGNIQTIAEGVPCAITLLGDTAEAISDAVENDTTNRRNWRNNGPLNGMTTDNLSAEANNNIDNGFETTSAFEMARRMGANGY